MQDVGHSIRRCDRAETPTTGGRALPPEVGEVFTIRSIGGVALFLFGTTFAWITPEFVTAGLKTTGALWSTIRIVALVTVAGFTVATWGLFQRAAWWETVAVISAVVGLLALVPYLVAAREAGETNPGFTALIIALGGVGVLVLLLVPPLERWVSSHVLSG